MHRLATSTSAETRLRFAASQLEELASYPEILVISSTRGAGSNFVRSYCLAGQGRIGLHRVTLFQLAFEIGVELLARRDMSPISGLAIEALTARTIHRCLRAGELDYFEPVADTIGFTRALGRTLSELRFAGVEPQPLEEVEPSGLDLARLLGRYQKELEQAGLADPRVIFEAAAEALGSGSHRFGGLPVILLDVLPHTRTETEFVTALASGSPLVAGVALPQDRNGIANLERALDVSALALENKEQMTSLDRLRRYVFLPETPEPTDPDDSLVFFSSTDEGRESVEIARYIQAASRTGTRFDQIAVLVRSPEMYQPLIEDAFHRSGIPGHYTRGSVRPNPTGRAFLALLACRSEGLSASRFAEYLSLGQVPMPDEKGEPPEPAPQFTPVQGELFPDVELPGTGPEADNESEDDPASDESPVVAGNLRAPFRWERLLVDAAVIGGKERWRKRLAGLHAEFAKQIDELGREDENRREYIQSQRTRLGHLSRFALPIIDSLDEFPVSATWGEWIDHLESLASRALREPIHVLSLLGELRPMDEVGPVELEEVRQVLSHRLTFLRNDPSDQPYGKVFVGTITEAAGRSFDIVFVPGVSEGTFPRKSLEDPLLLDEFRVTLDLNLALQDDRVFDERMLLHTAAGAARKKLFVSYPRMDIGQGRPRVPSFYALDVLRAAEGRIPDLGELEHRATETSGSLLGWPSPRRAADAVDDTEYDLATIGRLLHLPPPELRGRGRYLLGTNSHLARSLRTRWLRWHPSWSVSDGIVDPDPSTLEVLASHRLEARSYSPSSLQQFAACPYRFLLHSIHRLHVRDKIVPLEQMDPLTRGSLFHSVQFRLLTRLREEHRLPMGDENLAAATRMADEVLNEIAMEYREELVPAISRIWESEVEDLRTDLRGWLRQRAQLAADGEQWQPRYFEFSFGLVRSGDRDPESSSEEALILDGIRLRGSIDLVEEHSSRETLRIVEHKTGRAPAQPPVALGGGEVLQPMLYALAAEDLLGKPVGTSELSYCTQRGDYRRVEVSVNEASRKNTETAMRLIDQSLKEGFLPAAPRERACMSCDYRIVCGPYEQLRTARKDRGRLGLIEQLRQMP
jgi:ATP-dependent helicase/nuclease subunit B